ncbi:ABC transporter permease [Clostridium tyrobutyricum]|jgi:putative spermidine/putrescine transport system permease protein|uniref:ABC transporter permease n=1 Tax=Clostridium tyrobutyricum TaxID=1519 RepID=UPI0039F65A06
MWLPIVVVFVLFFLIAPVFVLIPLSFTSLSHFKFPPPSFSTQWYHAFFNNSQWIECFVRSLGVAALTVILSLIIGTMAAAAVTRLKFKYKDIFMGFMVMPMVIPVIIVSIALYNTFSPLRLTDTIPGIVLSHTLLAIPMVFVTMMTGLKTVDRNTELAAMGLGSKSINVFFSITLPQIKASILSAAIFAFSTSIDEVTVTMFIAGANTKTLPVAMWESMRNNITPDIAAVSTILIAITLVMIAVQGFVKGRTAKIKQN